MSRGGFAVLVQVEVGFGTGGSEWLGWLIRGMDSLTTVDGCGAGSGKDGWVSG